MATRKPRRPRTTSGRGDTKLRRDTKVVHAAQPPKESARPGPETTAMTHDPRGSSALPPELPFDPARFPADIVIPSDFAEGQKIQQEIVALLMSHGFGERDVFGIQLALEEAIVNAMKHGNQLDCQKSVKISFCFEQESFFVRISDEGRGFNPADVPDPTLEENLERPCGRGLMLMRHYMNEVRFLGRGNVVFMSKRREIEPSRNGRHP